MTDARLAAVNTLCEAERRNAYADALLSDFLPRFELAQRDTALATRLFYGVLQNRILLDRMLAEACTKKYTALHPKVRNILRVAAYQICFCDKIPDAAAVNEAVKQVRITGNGYAAGLCNAVLRRVADRKNIPLTFSDEAERLSVTYSHPLPLVRLLTENVPDTEAFLAADQRNPGITLRVNPLRATVPELTERFRDYGAKPLFGNCIAIERAGINPAALPEYTQGLFSVQDAASYLAVEALAPQPGERIVDGAAAPGGKTLAAAELAANQAEVLAFDIYEDKLSLISSNAARCGLNCVKTALRDAADPDPELAGTADAVIADLPCSGFGVIGKKPDIRYRDPAEAAALPELQKKLLHALSSYVKPGGRMVYSTCTVLKRENEEVAAHFLKQHPEFVPEDFFADRAPAFRSKGGCLTLYPHIHGTDGFFIAKFRRIR